MKSVCRYIYMISYCVDLDCTDEHKSSSLRSCAGLNPYLTLNTANSGTVLIDLASDDKEFQSVEEEVTFSSSFSNSKVWVRSTLCRRFIRGSNLHLCLTCLSWLNLVNWDKQT